MKRLAASLGVISMAVLIPGVAAAQSGQSLRLFSDTGFSGDSYRADRSIENLEAARFNDSARSLIAEGRGEVCLGAGRARRGVAARKARVPIGLSLSRR